MPHGTADGLRIVDSHVHFWDPASFHYSWMEEAAALRRRFGPEELRTASEGLALEAVVFVQAECDHDQALSELEWVELLAEDEPRIAAIVPFAPLESGRDARSVLERMAMHPKVRGVRRLLQWESDPRFCLTPEFLAGVRALEEVDLHFEICIFPPQLPAVLDLVRACPQVRFVLDHAGKPGIAAGVFEPWGRQIRELARLPNVCCKISGLCTEADPERWTLADLRPYVQHVLEQFGPERCLFGSDWPVATLATDYRRWVDTVEQLLGSSSAALRRAVFADNARRLYRLDRA